MNLKKFLAGVLACCAVIGTLPSVERTADKPVIAAANEYTLGDVNGDGYLDSRDASLILKEYETLSIGKDSFLSENERLAADVDRDGHIDSSDAAIILSAYASYGAGVNSEYQEIFDISPNMDAPADGGFTSAAIANSPIKPVFSVSRETILMDEAKAKSVRTVTVDISELGDNQRFWCSSGITIEYDTRLKPVLNRNGSPDVSVGIATKYLIRTSKHNEETGRIFIAFSGTSNGGEAGIIAGIKFELPDDVQYGDLYRIGIAYNGCEIFTNFDDDETGKLMQAHLFNDVIENNKHANDDNYEDWSTSIGYIKIEDEPIITTAPTTGEDIKVTLLGDANCDGQVTIADSTAILQSLGNPDKYGLSAKGAINADCCNPGDGVLPSDALAIQKLDAKIIKALPEIK